MARHDLTGARLKAASRLMEASAACDHRDRAVLFCVALETLAVGPLDIPVLGLHEEAENWAGLVASVDRPEGTPLDVRARHRIDTRAERLAENFWPRHCGGQEEQHRLWNAKQKASVDPGGHRSPPGLQTVAGFSRNGRSRSQDSEHRAAPAEEDGENLERSKRMRRRSDALEL